MPTSFIPLDSFRIYFVGRFGAGRVYIKARVERLQKAVGHLTATTVACAKNQYFHNNQLKR